MDAYKLARAVIARMGYDESEFAIERIARKGDVIEVEAYSPSRGMDISARISNDSGIVRVNADIETTAHSFKRSVVL